MDNRNGNISETFGKYNNADGINEVKNVNSSMWEPISAGKVYSAQTQPQKKTASSQNAKRPAGSAKKGQTKKSSKSPVRKDDLISNGRPQTQNKKEAAKKTAPKTSREAVKKSKPAAEKKPPVSRTPTGRDMREAARESQKYREDLFKSREEIKQEKNKGKNHDEISRKRNAKKRKKLIIKNAVTVGSVLLFAIIFIIIYCYSRGALIKKVYVEGGHIYSSEEIQVAAGITNGKNMLSLREKKVKKDLTKKLPYIKDVKLKYELPDTVILTVRETEDKYVITSQDSWLTLDTDGKVVSDKKQKIKSGMFQIEGFDYQEFSQGDTYKPTGDNKERYRIMEKMVSLYEKSDVVTSAKINLKNIEDVIVTVDGKIAIYFGDCKNLEEKIPYSSGIIAEVRNTGKSGYVDMRFDVGYFMPGSMTIQ